MHEVVTLQLGQQSNYVGTHFWNAQVCLILQKLAPSHGKKKPTDVQHSPQEQKKEKHLNKYHGIEISSLDLILIFWKCSESKSDTSTRRHTSPTAKTKSHQ